MYIICDIFQFINVGDLMKCHITGVLNHGEDKFNTFIDYNQYSHDPNLTINVILKTLLWTSESKVRLIFLMIKFTVTLKLTGLINIFRKQHL